MTQDELFDELKSLATQIDIPLRFEAGDFEGGLCVVNDERVLIVNKKASLPKKIATLALSLADCNLDAVFVKPIVREAIEDEIAKRRAEVAATTLTSTPAAAAAAPAESTS